LHEAKETGKRKAENTLPEQSLTSTGTPVEGDDTNLVNRFNRQMQLNAQTRERMTLEELIQNPQLAQSEEEQTKLREIQFYMDPAEKAQIDTIKADPKDKKLLQTLERVKQNCFQAYTSAKRDLDKQLNTRKVI
jgi:hypothetical protein